MSLVAVFGAITRRHPRDTASIDQEAVRARLSSLLENTYDGPNGKRAKAAFNACCAR